MKQLETEYKNQISLETPDLWSRIEAGVDKYESERPETSEPSQGTQKSEDNIVNFKTRKVMYTIGRITVAAVCVLCLFATVNLLKGGHSKSSEGTKTMAMDTAPAAAESNFAYTDTPNSTSFEYASEYADEVTEEAVEESAFESDQEKDANEGEPTNEKSINIDIDEIEDVPSLEELFYVDYEGELTSQLNALGFSNISDLQYEKHKLYKSSNLYGGSFLNEDTGEMCDITYTISPPSLEIICITRASDMEILYEKKSN